MSQASLKLSPAEYSLNQSGLSLWESQTPEQQSATLLNLPWMKLYGKLIPLKKYKHQFITIALPQEYDIKKLLKTISSLSYPYLKDSWLSVENFSGELHKENLHIHILKKEIYSKTKIIRDLSRKFKIAPNFINIKKGDSESDYLNRLHYINGEKQDELKQENAELDKQWRINNDIKQIYNL
jgi:hypothetical protein